MTEERKFCRICKNLGIDCEAGTFYCSLSHRADKLPNALKCDEFILCDFIARLEQENKSLYEEKNCLHKIIDRLLENSGYSKDIASAEDFEDVYEDMQIKRNELIELEQENKELSFAIEKCLENAGIECDDEEQALRSLLMLGNAHYKVLVAKEKLEQENKKLKYLISEEQCFEEGCNKCTKAYYTDDKYRSALEKIKDLCIHYENTNDKCVINCYAHFIVTDLIQNIINEVLNESK